MKRIIDQNKHNYTKEILNVNTRYLEMFNSMKIPYTLNQVEYAIKCYVHYDMPLKDVVQHTGVDQKTLKKVIPMYGFSLRSKIGRCRHFEGFCVFDSNFNPVRDVGDTEPKT